MKKNSIFKVILLCILLVIMLIVGVSCKKDEVKKEKENSNDIKELELKKIPMGYAVEKYKGENIDKFIIPEKYKGENIVRIDEKAFFESDIRELQLPSTIERIEEEAFSQCTFLEKINFPEKMEYIGNYAFLGCGLKEVILPKDLMEIGEGAFESCKHIENIENIVIPDNIKKMSKATFSACEKLTNVKIGKNVEIMASDLFYNCNSLKKIYIPASVKEMGVCVFNDVKDCEISCEVEKQPEGWDKDWIDYKPKSKAIFGQPKPTE